MHMLLAPKRTDSPSKPPRSHRSISLRRSTSSRSASAKKGILGDPDPTPVARGERARIGHESPTTAAVTPAGPPGRNWKRRQLARFAAGMDKAAACVLLSTRPKPSNSSRVSWLKSVSATRRARLARPASRQTPRRSADRGRRVSFPAATSSPRLIPRESDASRRNRHLQGAADAGPPAGRGSTSPARTNLRLLGLVVQK